MDTPDTISLSVLPIFSGDSGPDVQVATAFLTMHLGEPFVITAKHVLTENGKDSQLFLVPISGESSYRIDFPAFVSKSDDSDFAFIPISEHPRLLNLLAGSHKTISIEEFEKPKEFARSHYIVYGFPYRKTKYKYQTGDIILHPFELNTDEVDDKSLYSHYDKSERNHLILDYNKKIRRQDGFRNTGPHPHGVSGGPIFEVFVDENDFHIAAILMGVAIRWEDKKYIIMTRKSKIRKSLEQYIAGRKA